MEKTAYQKRRNQHIYQSNKGKICSTEGCDNKARIKGLCRLCYNRKSVEIRNEKWEREHEKEGHPA